MCMSECGCDGDCESLVGINLTEFSFPFIVCINAM